MILSLLKLRGVNWWRVGTITSVSAVIILICYVRLQHLRVQEIRAVYSHPMVVKKLETIKVRGPERIVIRTIKTPEKEEIIKVVEKAGTVESSLGWSLDQPLSPETVMKPPKRWLIGGGIAGWKEENRIEMLYGGVTLFNRLDLCLGYSANSRGLALVNWRF